jgi:methylamine dehydrogenase accessory protein MauD
VVSAEVGIGYRIGRVPYAVLIDGQGVIRAKGLVNTREHLESLIEAKSMNYASLQDYLEENHEHDQAASELPAHPMRDAAAR